ncbi:hypothetical protein KDE13_00005, partial [Campylobacter sp. faydin G-140]
VKLSDNTLGAASDTAISQRGIYQLLNKSKSFSENGYVTLPNNLMIQWGQWSKGNGDIVGERKHTIPFNLAFPNMCLTVSLSGGAGHSGDRNNNCITELMSFKQDSFNAFIYEYSASTQVYKLFWFAIGY